MNKIITLAFLGALAACSGRNSTNDREQTSNEDSTATVSVMNNYQHDQQFLRQHHPDLVELQLGNAKALICPAYQGRVMTTTADGEASYGWINYDLIRSGKILPHMNAFGGEDRFWLGPEGGQFALYFKKGDPFDAAHWQTPAAIDSDPFKLIASTPTSATFAQTVSLENYSGIRLDIGIERIITLLPETEINRQLTIDSEALKIVGIQSENTIANQGTHAWTAQTGMPSIWILGMMNASPAATIIVPYRAGVGQPVNDAYFGKVPADRLTIGKTSALFKADARYRSKIGVAPDRATNWVGSYDPSTHTLTLVTFDFNSKDRQYVNSAWEQQKDPFAGDVINAYNDGPMQAGQSQMGQFYELESSSPAANLAPGAKMRHRHTTFHVQGPEDQLNQLAKRLLLTDLEMLKGR
ncbi:DUF6786 family protein [Spirosoma sp. KNUC1025]|uniref:DUF6786 family protein n=1 Tax=Spirosoma sp. KNUC1025 TaxID=2894082 RepID=UPI0038690983|nr:hypothetical protein LN737_25575 [Spirosoma sp. KNUC1025]